MVLIIIALLSVGIALIRGGSFTNIFKSEVKVFFLFIVSLLLFIIIKVGNTAGIALIENFTYYIMLLAYFLFLIGCIINLTNMPMGLMMAGALLNFAVIFFNGGKMPISAEMMSIANLTESFVEQSATMSIANSGTTLSFLGGIIPIPLPSIFAEVISPGTVLIGVGLFGVIQNMFIEYEYYDDDDEYDDTEEDDNDEDFEAYAEAEEESKVDKKALRKAEKERKKAEKKAKKAQIEDDYPDDFDDDDITVEENDIFNIKTDYANADIAPDEFENGKTSDLLASDILDGILDETIVTTAQNAPAELQSELSDETEPKVAVDLETLEETIDVNNIDLSDLSDFTEEKTPIEPVEQLQTAEKKDDVQASEYFSQFENEKGFYENSQAFFDELNDDEAQDLSQLPDFDFEGEKKDENYEEYFAREDDDLTKAAQDSENTSEEGDSAVQLVEISLLDDEEPSEPEELSEPEEIKTEDISEDEQDALLTADSSEESVLITLEDDDVEEEQPEIEVAVSEDIFEIPEKDDIIFSDDILPEPVMDFAFKPEDEPLPVIEDDFKNEIDFSEDILSEEMPDKMPVITEVQENPNVKVAKDSYRDEDILVTSEDVHVESEPAVIKQTDLEIFEESVSDYEKTGEEHDVAVPVEEEPTVETMLHEEAVDAKEGSLEEIHLEETVPESLPEEEEIIDTDSPFVIKGGRIIENPNYKFKKNNVVSKGTEEDGTTESYFIPKTRNPSFIGRPNFSPTVRSADYKFENKESNEDSDFEKVDMKIGDVQIKFWKNDKNDK